MHARYRYGEDTGEPGKPPMKRSRNPRRYAACAFPITIKHSLGLDRGSCCQDQAKHLAGSQARECIVTHDRTIIDDVAVDREVVWVYHDILDA